jgi:hypothetical protein
MSIQQLSSLLKKQGNVTIPDFCEKWIPKLYKLHPGDHGYKKACITELSRLLQGSIKASTIARTWKIDGVGGVDYPLYMDALLDLANQRYECLEAMRELKPYS